MKRTLTVAFTLLTMAMGGAALAGPQLLDGNVSANRVENLVTQIQWNRSLPQAEAQAAQQGKMIFWVHMLGDMSGAT